MTFRDLEQRAFQAHKVSMRWADFWPQVAEAVKAMQPYDRVKFGRLYQHLLPPLVTGDTAGQEPIGSGVDCWGIAPAMTPAPLQAILLVSK